jgi:hypothetical protein
MTPYDLGGHLTPTKGNEGGANKRRQMTGRERQTVTKSAFNEKPEEDSCGKDVRNVELGWQTMSSVATVSMTAWRKRSRIRATTRFII